MEREKGESLLVLGEKNSVSIVILICLRKYLIQETHFHFCCCCCCCCLKQRLPNTGKKCPSLNVCFKKADLFFYQLFCSFRASHSGTQVASTFIPTDAPIGALKCYLGNYGRRINRPTDWSTDGQTGNREAKLPMIIFLTYNKQILLIGRLFSHYCLIPFLFWEQKPKIKNNWFIGFL